MFAHEERSGAIVQESVTVQPNTQQNVKCRVVFHGRAPELQEEQWETEPSALPSGLLVARTLTPSSQFSDVPIRVMNLNEEPKCMEEGTVVSDLEPVTVMGAADQTTGGTQEPTNYVKNPGYPPTPDYTEKLASEVDPSTPKEVVSKLRELMMKYRRVFSESDQDLGLTDILQHRIDTGTARPIRQPLRRFPPAHVEAISSEVDKLLAQGVIEPASSPTSS